MGSRFKIKYVSVHRIYIIVYQQENNIHKITEDKYTVNIKES